ncbi:hypothetical protein L1049_023633 [Liquidambar formosana]|uniref:C2H2-type domain-containing protein n=1 Tax=Liquidambar formosana TaxID=63359 RepID=A0AAP0RTD2_LIQFO
MAGRGELGFPKTNIASLREQAARTTLRNVRMQGHTYIELREDGKRFIFFCTLCLAPCYSDSVLFDHLKGNLHTERYAAAKVTLLGPNPWPFNDGVFFFDNSCEQNKQLAISNGNQDSMLDTSNNDNNLAIVKHSVNGNNNLEAVGVHSDSEFSSGYKNLHANGGNCDMVIPGVLLKDEKTDLELRFMGFGQIAARFREKHGASDEISKIWCEWLGKRDAADEDTFMVPEHDFAVVTFSYNYELGRRGLVDDLKSLLSLSPRAEIENGEDSGRKRKKSFSDPEDVSESLSNQYDSSGEDSLGSNSSTPRLLLEGYDDQLLHTRFISSKAMRRELRRQQRVAAERMCDICQHKMLPGKDVAALLNLKTERLVCSSRNVNGAFHVFHTSCLIHWVLLCEFEILTNQSVYPEVKRRSRRKSAGKCNEKGKESEKGPKGTQIYSVFCPECQGTGIHVEGDELEKPRVPLSQMFRCKIKASNARRAWVKNPEVLQNCSTGFHFPSQSEEIFQVLRILLKTLPFSMKVKVRLLVFFVQLLGTGKGGTH